MSIILRSISHIVAQEDHYYDGQIQWGGNGDDVDDDEYYVFICKGIISVGEAYRSCPG